MLLSNSSAAQGPLHPPPYQSLAGTPRPEQAMLGGGGEPQRGPHLAGDLGASFWSFFLSGKRINSKILMQLNIEKSIIISTFYFTQLSSFNKYILDYIF